MVAWAELLWEVGGFVLETAVDLFAPDQKTEPDERGSAPHLPLPSWARGPAAAMAEPSR